MFASSESSIYTSELTYNNTTMTTNNSMPGGNDSFNNSKESDEDLHLKNAISIAGMYFLYALTTKNNDD